MRWLALLPTLVGCNSILGIRDQPPFEVVIDAAATVDAPVDTLAPGGDDDGDTIVNDADNCPTVTNTDQRNHDNDAHGDACDGCPHLASTSDPDLDSDGIGDACDPDPSMANARVAWFGFYDAAELAGWKTLVTWTVQNGHASHTTLTDNAFLGPPSIYTAVDVQVAVTVDMLGDNAQPSGAFFRTGVNEPLGNPTAATFCGLLEANNGILYVETRPPTTQELLDWPLSLVGLPTQLRLDNNEMARCVGSSGATHVEATVPAAVNQGGSVVLYAQRAAVRYDYLFIVGPPP